MCLAFLKRSTDWRTFLTLLLCAPWREETLHPFYISYLNYETGHGASSNITANAGVHEGNDITPEDYLVVRDSSKESG